MPWAATAAVNRSRASATESQSCSSRHPKRGRPSLSPRRSYGSEARPTSHPLSLGSPWPQPSPTTLPWLAECAGNEDSTSPGTATTSHSRPLAAWTVMTWTASGRASTQPRSRPRSSSTAASSQARKPPSVGRSALPEKVAATSAKASRWARAAPGDHPTRASTSMSSPRAVSASPTSSGSPRPVRDRRRRTVAPRPCEALEGRRRRCAGPPHPPTWPGGGRRGPRRCSPARSRRARGRPRARAGRPAGAPATTHRARRGRPRRGGRTGR